MSEVSPAARRLTRPRWLDARLALGVLLVLLSVVIGARVLASAGTTTGVWVARVPLVPGERVAAGDLRVGQVRFHGEGSGYVAAAGAAPVGYLVTRYVGAGELVPVASLRAAAGTTGQTRSVTVPVSPGHLPDDLAHGDVVDVYLTVKPASTTGQAAVTPEPRLVLAAVPVESSGGGARSLTGTGSLDVGLDVPSTDVPAVVQAAETGSLDLVRVPAAIVPALAAASPGPTP